MQIEPPPSPSNPITTVWCQPRPIKTSQITLPSDLVELTKPRRLRETVALGKVGVLAAGHGLGGAGKTAFAHEYGGGRRQVRLEGKS